MNDNYIVQFESVSKKYFNIIALNDISFNLQKGEIFGYIGPNGAGKTTTIKIMVGLIKNFTGNYLLKEYKMPHENPDIYKMFGYLPQDVAFQEWRTVEHALYTFGILSGIPDYEIQDRIKKTLEYLDISNYLKKKIKSLSGGTIQKVGLAQAILHSPKLLVLDEPLSGLDPEARIRVKNIIRDFRNNGTTVFFSSHILSDVEDVADRVGIIFKGKIIKIGSIPELKKHLYKEKRFELELSYKPNDLICLSKIPLLNRIEEVNEYDYKLFIDLETDSDFFAHIIIKTLIENGFHIRSFKEIIPTLDEIYLEYLKGAENGTIDPS